MRELVAEHGWYIAYTALRLPDLGTKDVLLLCVVVKRHPAVIRYNTSSTNKLSAILEAG